MKTIVKIMILFVFSFVASAETLISKSATVIVTDDKSHKIAPWGDAYIPAGTKILNINKSKDYRGSKRNLFITDSGLHVYFAKRKYWNVASVESFKKQGGVVFIKRYFEAKIPFGSKGAEITIPFTRGETYQLVDEDDVAFKINITDKDKLEGFGAELKIAVSIPRKFANLNEFESDLVKKEMGYFESINIDGAVGILKHCGTEILESYPTNIKPVNIGSYFQSIDIKGDKEKLEIKGLGKNINIRREYYRRFGEEGLYKITKITSCDDTRNISYHISTPYVSDVKIDKDWVRKAENSINFDASTGRAVISCPGDYFAVEDEFLNDFHSRDIPFLVYKTTRWKRFKNQCEKIVKQ